jgi:hypothetical protein
MMGNTHSYILALILQDASAKYLRERTPDELVLLFQMLNVNAAIVQARLLPKLACPRTLATKAFNE